MASCLGLYIESNVIKYAKVSKDKEILKVESFGIKFYDKLGDAINQIVSETFSYKIPISVNLSEEMYNYFYMFNLLNEKDLKKAIETEFESFCYEKNINRNAFETRYALANSAEDKDKVKVIHVSENKAVITKIIQAMDDNKISTLSPIGTSISNLISIKPKENAIIVNLEKETIITTIVNQKIYHVEKLEEGAGSVLDKIIAKENSFAKAYEICKNTTIYTMEGRELQDEENEHLEEIMPTLYKVVTKLQDYIANTAVKFDTIYITGTLSVVNNIDLYFQEFFTVEKCEILKPYFITGNVKINIKDYIEVNSAIALALQGLGYGVKSMNFKNREIYDRLPEWTKIEIGSGKNPKIDWSFNLGEKLDHTEKWMTRAAGGVLILMLLYSGFSIYLNDEIKKKTTEIDDVNSSIKTQIALVEKDTDSVKQKTNKYIELRDNLLNINQQIESNARTKNIIPNLLVRIMSIIPEDVQLTEIENTTGDKIVIKAQSKYYEQLGYLKAKIKEDSILKNVTSSQGDKQGEFVKVIIEGDLQ